MKYFQRLKCGFFSLNPVAEDNVWAMEDPLVKILLDLKEIGLQFILATRNFYVEKSLFIVIGRKSPRRFSSCIN